MVLLASSLLFAIIGNVFTKNPPKDINNVYGFRTKKSMKNKNNWNKAQKLFGKYTKSLIIPSFILGILIFIYEFYSLTYLKTTEHFIYGLITESVILVMALFSIVYLVNRSLD